MDPVMIDKNIARNIPCELMKYDWNIKYNGDFCLNPKKCIPEALKHKLEKHDICFNYSKGKRVLVYVRKDANKETSGMDKSVSGVSGASSVSSVSKVPIKVSPKKSPLKPLKPLTLPKVCPEGKVLNPKTGRCIMLKNMKKTPLKSPKSPKSPKPPKQPKQPSKSPKQPKVCPEGKVLNPKTNRCILIKKKK
jgi:hypothetical protein